MASASKTESKAARNGTTTRTRSAKVVKTEPANKSLLIYRFDKFIWLVAGAISMIAAFRRSRR